MGICMGRHPRMFVFTRPQDWGYRDWECSREGGVPHSPTKRTRQRSTTRCSFSPCWGSGFRGEGHSAPAGGVSVRWVRGFPAGRGCHTAVRVGVLGWFNRSVLHSQPAKFTSSTSERLMKAWFCEGESRSEWVRGCSDTWARSGRHSLKSSPLFG